MSVAALALAASLVAAQAAADTTAPTVELAVPSDTLTIGDHVTVRVVVRGFAGADLVFPEYPDSGAIASVAPPRFHGGRETALRSAEYELAVWAVGALELPAREVRVEWDDSVRALPVPAAVLNVASVLPESADPDTLAWRPAWDVLGPSWSRAEMLAAAAAALLALALLWAAVRSRRSAGPPPPAPPRPARERALEALGELERSDLLKLGETKAFYSALSHVLREFLAEAEPEWGAQLTTAELVQEVGADGVSESVGSMLERLLAEADHVKFARFRPPRYRAGLALDATRAWIERFERVVPEPEPEREPDTPGAELEAGAPRAEVRTREAEPDGSDGGPGASAAEDAATGAEGAAASEEPEGGTDPIGESDREHEERER